MAKKKKPPKRQRQTDLEETGKPGFERDPELVSLASDLADHRHTRMEAGKLESETQEALMSAMEKKGLEEFIAEGMKIQIVHEKKKIKIKKMGREAHRED